MCNDPYGQKSARIQAEGDLEFAKELRDEREKQLDELWEKSQNRIPGIISGVSSSIPVADAVSDNRDRYYLDSLQSLEHEIKRNKLKEQLLLSELKQKSEEFSDIFGRAQTLEKELSRLAEVRQLYEVVQTRFAQKDLERSADMPGAIAKQLPAFVASQPSQDRRFLYTAIVLILDGLAMLVFRWLLRRRRTA